MMQQTTKLMLTLSVLCAICTGLVTLAYQGSAGTIAQRQAEKLQASYAEVLPQAQSLTPAMTDGNKLIQAILVSQATSQPNGYVYTVTPVGYGGPLTILVGIDAQTQQVSGIKILAQTETPGFGSKSTEPSFTQQFAKKDALSALQLTKSNEEGAIQAITGATITSNAVTSGVNAALEHYQAHFASAH